MALADAPLLPDTELSTQAVLRRRIILAVDALDKAGKTRFGFTAPKPILYLDLDIGREGVIDKFKNPLIVVSKPFTFRALDSMFLPENKDKATSDIAMEKALPELDRFRRTYLAGLREPIVRYNGKPLRARTIIVDTGTEVWELLRLCEFGKLTQVKPHHYAAVNGMMRDLVRAGFDSDVNVLWLHKLKAEWIQSSDPAKGASKSGTMERQGFGDMSFLVQANCLLYRAPTAGKDRTMKWKAGEALQEFPLEKRADKNDLGFRFRIGNSRHDPSLEGIELTDEMIDFKTVAQMMVPESTTDDWADVTE